MAPEMSPKKRFTVLLITIYVVSLSLMTVVTYLVVRENAIRDAAIAGRLYLAAFGAVKHYIAEELRPVFYKELPGRFIVQGMSRSFAASRVAMRVQRELPNYQYKNASLNATNPMNDADEFEKKVITLFAANRDMKEWQGFRSRGGSQFYSMAVAGDPFTGDCLKCHGNPDDAPAEFRERYGTKRGYHVKAGDLIDATFVYIPIGVPLAEARKTVLVLVGIYLLFGTVILSIVIRRFSALYNRTDEDRQRIEDVNLELMNLNHDMETIITERTMNLIALSVADRVRNPATTIAATFNRILKKEELSGPLKERMTDMLIEAQKLDAIVRDYEAVLKKKQTMFKLEDLNEIVRSVMPLVEPDRKSKGIRLLMNLSADPKQCMANRQLLRVAILHIVKNAIESASDEGEVSITTEGDQDHVWLMVTDNGIGIPPEDLAKIFSLFFSSKKNRLGMGLPLAKQIVGEHKGEISVKSESGKGTTFTLTFPVRWTEQELSK
jgi:signal transduction histidine kinase